VKYIKGELEMFKGIILGIFAQLAFAIGLTLINQAKFENDQDFLKSNVVLILAGCFSVIILSYFFLRNSQNWGIINGNNFFYLLFGSLFLLVIGEYFFLKGASVSNVTTVSLTALAFPIVALLTEYTFFKFGLAQKPPAIEINHLIGFVFSTIGFILFTKS